jgi:hypothetical protein
MRRRRRVVRPQHFLPVRAVRKELRQSDEREREREWRSDEGQQRQWGDGWTSCGSLAAVSFLLLCHCAGGRLDARLRSPARAARVAEHGERNRHTAHSEKSNSMAHTCTRLTVPSLMPVDAVFLRRVWRAARVWSTPAACISAQTSELVSWAA